MDSEHLKKKIRGNCVSILTPLAGRAGAAGWLEVHTPGEDLPAQVVHLLLVGGGGVLVHDQIHQVHLVCRRKNYKMCWFKETVSCLSVLRVRIRIWIRIDLVF
jgi:hypothetical protein